MPVVVPPRRLGPNRAYVPLLTATGLLLTPIANNNFDTPVQPYRILQSWIPSPTLLGKDQFYGAPGQVPGYDNPLPKAAAPIQQTWTQGVPLSLLTAPPVVKPNSDWPRPTPPARLLQNWTTQLILLGKDQFYGAPGQVPGYDNPLPARATPLQQSWTSPGIIPPPVTGQPIAQTDWPTPRAATPILQSWITPAVQALPTVLRNPMRAPYFPAEPIKQSWNQSLATTTLSLPPPVQPQSDWPLPKRATPIPQGWTQNLSVQLALPPPVQPQSDWPTPRAAAPIQQTWLTQTSLNVRAAQYQLRNPMQCSMLAHWNQDRYYLSFENMSYSPDGISPNPNAVVRGPLQQRRVEPAWILQSWTQSASLSAVSLKVQPRQPMQAPQFAPFWQQAWNPVNLLGLYTATNNFRFRVTGSVIVRRLK